MTEELEIQSSCFLSWGRQGRADLVVVDVVRRSSMFGELIGYWSDVREAFASVQCELEKAGHWCVEGIHNHTTL
jgi:hypothetical protein